MSTFVLVHGAWHGGWCWQQVSRRLRDAGHDVLCPTLTGLGERAHLLTRETGLEAHVRDIVAVLDYEDLHDAILVGHSYGGMVVTQVAAQAPARLRRLVCLDAFLPEVGERALDLLPPHAAEHYRVATMEQGEGWWVPPRPLENLGVRDAASQQWLVGRLTPHPFKTYTDPAGRGASEVRVPGTYLLCAGWAGPFRTMAERAAALGWPVSELPADHEVMATDPALLADRLLMVAGEPAGDVERAA